MMKIERININGIPSVIWGDKSSKAFVAVHGNMSNKEDDLMNCRSNNEKHSKLYIN